MDVYAVQTLCGLILLLLGPVEGLNCWHCIAENCEQNPEANYKAIQKTCLAGQQCQKVFFEMQSDIKSTKYTSVVRSCAEQCTDQNDFDNCTNWQLTTTGCVRRTCCDDEHLCNSAWHEHGRPGCLLLLAVVSSICLLLIS